jgi:hypothetical protein
LQVAHARHLLFAHLPGLLDRADVGPQDDALEPVADQAEVSHGDLTDHEARLLIEQLEPRAVRGDVRGLALDDRGELGGALRHLGVDVAAHGGEARVGGVGLREHRRDAVRVGDGALAGGAGRDEPHLLLEPIAEGVAQVLVFDEARVAVAHLHPPRLDRLAHALDLLAVALEVALAGGQLGLPLRHHRRVLARHGVRVVDHAPQAVDHRLHLVDLELQLLQPLRHRVPLAVGDRLARDEVGVGGRQPLQPLAELAPLSTHLRELARRVVGLDVVEALGDGAAGERDAVEQEQELLVAGPQLGEGPHPVRRPEHGAQLEDEAVRLLDEVAALRHVVEHGEGASTVALFARELDRERGQLRGLVDGRQLFAREHVVVDRRIVRAVQEAVDPLAHRVVLGAHRLVGRERLVELARAQQQVGAQQRAVGHVGVLRVGDREHLEGARRAVGVAEPHVDPGELVERGAELGRLAVDVVVRVGRLEPLVGLVKEPPDRHPGQVDDLLVLGRVGRQLRHLPERLDRRRVPRRRRRRRRLARRELRRRRLRLRLAHRHHPEQVARLVVRAVPRRHRPRRRPRPVEVAPRDERLRPRVLHERVAREGRLAHAQEPVEVGVVLLAQRHVDQPRVRPRRVRRHARLGRLVDHLAVRPARRQKLARLVVRLAQHRQPVGVRRAVVGVLLDQLV